MAMFHVVLLPEYISLSSFARECSNVDDFNTRNKCLTAELLKQGYRYHKLRKAFSKFYRRHYEFISKFNVGLKSLLNQGLSEPEFYGDLVYKFKRIRGMTDFSDQFRKKYNESVAWSTGAQLIIFFCFRFSVVLFYRPGISIRHATHCICRVLVFASI